jgi:flagellar biosynthesis/type III secretory pathway protein FliH
MTRHAPAAILRATRIPANEFAARLAACDALSQARAEAAQIRADALAEASAMRQAALAEITTERAAFQTLVKECTDDVLDQNRLEASAAAMLDVLDKADAICRRFDALSPWIGALVMDTVSQIIGVLEPDERLQRLLTQALGDARRGWQVRLRAHPDTVDLLRNLLLHWAGPEGVQSAVTDVVADDTLPKGGCLVESEQGLIDITVEAQIAALCHEFGLTPADLHRPEAKLGPDSGPDSGRASGPIVPLVAAADGAQA